MIMQANKSRFDFMGLGFLIICFMEMIITVAVLFFILGTPMNSFVVPLGTILSGIIYWKISDRTRKEKVVTLLITMLIVAFCIMISGSIFDYSWDGNSYRKLMTGVITEGWNPVYQFFHTVQDNYATLNGPYPVSVTETMPKASWIFASAIHAFTKNIEAGKCFTVLSMVACFGIFYSTFRDYLEYSNWKSIVIAGTTQCSPIILSQALTYYADAYLANLFFVVVLLLALLILQKRAQEDKMVWWTIFLSIVIGLNTKVNGLIMMGIPCILFVFYWVLCRFKDSEGTIKVKTIDSVRLICAFAIAVIVAVCFIGTTSYFQNFVKTGNPIYPTDARGDTPQDQLPGVLLEMSNWQRFLYSLFSETSNTIGWAGEQPKTKVPFTFTTKEWTITGVDVRSGGWGVLFSGIFLISLIIISICAIKAYHRRDKSSLAMLLILVVSVLAPSLIFPGMWWARYNMGILIIPIIALAILLNKKGKRLNISCIVAVTLTLLLVFDCIPALKRNVKVIYTSQITRSELFDMRQKVGADDVAKVWFVNTFDGLQFNLKDQEIRYDRVEEKPANGTSIYNGYLVWSK